MDKERKGNKDTIRAQTSSPLEPPGWLTGPQTLPLGLGPKLQHVTKASYNSSSGSEFFYLLNRVCVCMCKHIYVDIHRRETHLFCSVLVESFLR